MNPNKRGLSPFSSKASPVKNTTNQIKPSSNKAQALKGAVGMRPKNTGYAKIRGTVSG